MEPTVERFEGFGGVQIVADHRGDDSAPPVLLLHGGGQTRGSWFRTAERIAGTGRWAWTYDARGHGQSDWSADKDYRLSSFAADLATITAAIGRPPVVIGASLGGLTGLLALGDTTGWVNRESGLGQPGPTPPVAGAGLVLVDALPELNKGGTERIKDFMTERLAEGFATLEEAADSIAAYNPHRPRPTDLSGLERNLRRGEDGRWYWHWDPAFLMRLEGSLPPAEIRDLDLMMGCAHAISEPMLLVRGKLSDVVDAEAAKRFVAEVDGVEFADVSDAGHMVAGDHNDAFTEALLAFLDRHLPV